MIYMLVYLKLSVQHVNDTYYPLDSTKAETVLILILVKQYFKQYARVILNTLTANKYLVS